MLRLPALLAAALVALPALANAQIKALDANSYAPSNLTSRDGKLETNQTYQGEVALTVGTPAAYAARALKAVCTVAGNVTVTYGDPQASTGSWPVNVGTQVLPIAVKQVNSQTATCSYFNLK